MARVAPQFLDRLRLELAGESQWRLLAEFRFDSKVTGDRLTVPGGFLTDLASVPRAPLAYWLTGGYAVAESVLHDWTYRTQWYPRDVADAVFFEAMDTDGTALDIPRMAAWRRWAMWRAVRWFGGSAYEQMIRSLMRGPPG